MKIRSWRSRYRCSGAARPSVRMLSASRSEAGGLDSGDRAREQTLTTPQVSGSPHPHSQELGPSPPPAAAHHPASQPAGRTLHAAEPPAGGARGLPARPAPDAAEGNAETSSGICQPIRTGLPPNTPAPSCRPSNQAAVEGAVLGFKGALRTSSLREEMGRAARGHLEL